MEFENIYPSRLFSVGLYVIITGSLFVGGRGVASAVLIAHAIHAFYHTCLISFQTYKVVQSIKSNPKDSYTELEDEEAASMRPILSKKHVFIIPNYNIPINVLRSTLQNLSDHQFSYMYTVILSMEDHECGHANKAEQLICEYKDFFERMFYTSHFNSSEHSPNKAANVNSCLRTIDINVDDDTMITVMDADVEIPSAYMTEFAKLVNSTDIFVAPTVFDRNTLTTPVFVCIADYFKAMLGITNCLPTSAYSMSMYLFRKIGFLDTHPETLANDGWHTFIKTTTKTKGNVNTRLVPFPVIKSHLEVMGYVNTYIARLVQSERHARGIADVGYIIRTGFKSFSEFSFCAKVLLRTLEIYMVPALFVQNVFVYPFVMWLFRYHVPRLVVLAFCTNVGLGMVMIACYEVIRQMFCRSYLNRDPFFNWPFVLVYLIYPISEIVNTWSTFVYVIIVKHLLNYSKK